MCNTCDAQQIPSLGQGPQTLKQIKLLLLNVKKCTLRKIKRLAEDLQRNVIFFSFHSSLLFNVQLYMLILQIFIQKVRVIQCLSFRPNSGAALTQVVYPFSKLICFFQDPIMLSG